MLGQCGARPSGGQSAEASVSGQETSKADTRTGNRRRCGETRKKQGRGREEVTYNNTYLAPIYGSKTSGVNGTFASSAAVWWPMAMSINAA